MRDELVRWGGLALVTIGWAMVLAGVALYATHVGPRPKPMDGEAFVRCYSGHREVLVGVGSVALVPGGVRITDEDGYAPVCTGCACAAYPMEVVP
mgnify:CR=1 FL=1